MNAKILKEFKRRYHTIVDALNNDDYKSLSNYEIEYYAKVMSQNRDLQQSHISYTKQKLADMEEQLAKYDEYANKLKALL